MSSTIVSGDKQMKQCMTCDSLLNSWLCREFVQPQGCLKIWQPQLYDASESDESITYTSCAYNS